MTGSSQETVLFTNAWLIDGTGKEPLSGASLAVEGGLIKEVADRPLTFPSARTVDLQGRTLMPGLIDAHVHAGNVLLTSSATASLRPAVFVHRASLNLATDLALGFTTVRDAGGLDLGFKEAIAQGLIKGPRLLLSVSPLIQSSGETVGPRNSLGVYSEVCDGPDQVRRAARRTLGRGADQIKVFADGEVAAQVESDRARPGQWKFTVEEIRAAVETAQAAGTYVMAHVYSPRAVKNCLEAGVRSLEHANLMDRETAELMAEKGAFYVPTLTVYQVLSTIARDQLPAFTREKLDEVGRSGWRALELAREAGVRIASGSDIIGPFQHLKGRELALKAEVMGPMGAIVSATRTNAELLNLADRLGTLAAGKEADLIVVDGNPLQDLSLFEKGLEKVLLVMKSGRIMKDLLTAG